MDQFQIQFRACCLKKLQFLKRQFQKVRLDHLQETGVIRVHFEFFRLAAPFSSAEQDHASRAAINHASELLATANWPIHRPRGETKL